MYGTWIIIFEFFPVPNMLCKSTWKCQRVIFLYQCSNLWVEEHFLQESKRRKLNPARLFVKYLDLYTFLVVWKRQVADYSWAPCFFVSMCHKWMSVSKYFSRPLAHVLLLVTNISAGWYKRVIQLFQLLSPFPFNAILNIDRKVDEFMLLLFEHLWIALGIAGKNTNNLNQKC